MKENTKSPIVAMAMDSSNLGPGLSEKISVSVAVGSPEETEVLPGMTIDGIRITEENEFDSAGVITTLTPHQFRQIKVYSDKWNKICVDTKPADRPLVEDSFLKFYELSGYAVPEFHWVDCPKEGCKKAAQLGHEREDVTLDEIRARASDAAFGTFESYWVSMVDYSSNELPIKKNPFFDISVKITENTGAYWMFDRAVVICEKPLEVNMEDGQLHSPDGIRPAIEYRNGSKLYAHRGKLMMNLVQLQVERSLDAKVKEDLEKKL